MTKTLSYKEKIDTLLASYSIEEIGVFLGVNTRTIQNYIAKTNPTTPRPFTKRKIDEIYTKYLAGEPLGEIKNPDHNDQDFKDRYIKLLEQTASDRQSYLEQVKENGRKIEELTKRLEILSNSILAVAAQGEGYQNYWAEHFPPKGLTPQQVMQGVRKKRREALEVFLKDGIVV